VSYSTSEDSSPSSDDESSESELEEIRQKRVRKILSLRRKAKSLRNDIMLLTGQKINGEEFPSLKQMYRRRLPVKLKKPTDRCATTIRSGRSSTSSSRRNSIDYSRRKICGKIQKLPLDPEEAEKRTEQAIFDIDATIDEVLGNLRRQCEAEERRGKIVRNTNRTSKMLSPRTLPALYQHLVSKDLPVSSGMVKKSTDIPSRDLSSLMRPSVELDDGGTLGEKDVSPTKNKTVVDNVEIPITLSEKVTVLPENDMGPISVTKKPDTERLVSDTEETPGLVETGLNEGETVACENEHETPELPGIKSDHDIEVMLSEKHLVTIENFSPTSGRSKFIQPILVQISESNEGVVTINMPIMPVPKLVFADDLGDPSHQQGEAEIPISQQGETEITVTNIETCERNNDNQHESVVSKCIAPTLNSTDHTPNVLNLLHSPSDFTEHLGPFGPLSVVHRDSVNKNENRLSQSGRLYLHLFNDKSSKSIMCTNCDEYFTTETFLCHLHGGETNSLLDVEAKRTLDIQSAEPSEWEQTQWREFKAKCRKLEAETPHDGEKNGKNGNKIVKALQFELIKTQFDKVVPDPSVRQSTRVRKRKQLYPIEKYMFSSANVEIGDKMTEDENVQKIVKGEIRKVTNISNKLQVEKTKKFSVDNNKNQVHENGNVDTDDHKNWVVENGKNSATNDKNHFTKTPVLFKKVNTTLEVTKTTPPSPLVVIPGQRISSRESTSRFKRRLSDVLPTTAKRLCLSRHRARLSTSPARSTRSHSGDKPC
jgi:hypothetical protein